MIESRKPNRLINETSPYLLQHAHNPVDWQPWSEEAFAEAKEKNKPVLVSIGYSSCHWCHVMERESFEDERVAAFMNEHFVNIKVDREERPDVDHIYMEALQAMTGSGGWPLNIFLTPDKKPFYGGTYFPPEKYANRPSWLHTLQGITEAYTTKGEQITEQAEELTAHLAQTNTLNTKSQLESSSKISDDDFKRSFDAMVEHFDKVNGGFGYAPKFPSTFSINYLLNYSFYYKEEKAKQHALHTLDEMLKGGIYDQLSGGLCRYSTDNRWHVPHFEKMLYDNTLFLQTLCNAWKAAPNENYLTAIKQTVHYLTSEMMSPEYLFYSAYDADSEGVEGKYYCWTKAEVESILKEDTEWFCEYFNISTEGNWEETNILFRKHFPAEFASKNNMDVKVFLQKLDNAVNKLLAVRATRIKPGLDDKALLAWNCLMNMALIECYYVTGEEEIKETTLKNFTAIRKLFAGNTWGGLMHNYKNGKAANRAMLDDVSLYIQMLLENLQLTGDISFADEAIEKTKYAIAHFYSDKEKFFYYSDKDQQDLIIRKIDYYDSVVPSGNSVMFHNLHYLYLFTGDEEYKAMTEEMLRKVFSISTTYPTSFSNWLSNFLFHYKSVNEITYTQVEIDTETLLKLHRAFIPGAFIVPIEVSNDRYIYTRGKTVTAQPQYYLCRNFFCFAPLNKVDELFGKMIY